MSARAGALLAELSRTAREYGPGRADEKRELVARLAVARQSSGAELLELHELLCFLRAYPDDAALLAEVERALEGFADRVDVARHRRALEDTGVAGSVLHFPFHWATARWLCRHWPERLSVDFAAFGARERERFELVLPLLLPYAEWPDFELPFGTEGWLSRLKGEDQTDAAFLVRRFEALRASPRVREALFHDLALPMCLELGPDGPSRTRLRAPVERVHFQERPLSKSRPDLRKALGEKPRSVRELSSKEGARMIELAREALVMRGRDLDGIMYGNPDDVRLVDAGAGLTLACFGLLPEQRALVESIYVFLLMKNGVPIGYFQAALLFGSAEVNYHLFPTFRGAEAARIYARSLAAVRHLFGVDAFSVHPYQLGHENADALSAGAFWFYAKLGFCPEAPELSRLLERERRALARSASHRTSSAVLRRLASRYVFFYLGRRREDVAGKVALSRIPLAISRVLAERFGSDREKGLRVLSDEAGQLLGVEPGALGASERLTWQRWAPLVHAIPQLPRWGESERRAFGAIIIAKGARSEDDFVRSLAAHRRLRRALLGLAQSV